MAIYTDQTLETLHDTLAARPLERGLRFASAESCAGRLDHHRGTCGLPVVSVILVVMPP
jgi:hypothetical protein